MTGIRRSASLGIVLGLAVLMSACSGGAPPESSPMESQTSQTTTRPQETATPAPQQNPWVGRFAPEPGGDPVVLASGGTSNPSATWQTTESGETLMALEFGEQMWSSYVDDGLTLDMYQVRDEDYAEASFFDGMFFGAADGTARWELREGIVGSMISADCPTEAMPPTQEATDIVIDRDGEVESFVLHLPQLMSYSAAKEYDGCDSWAVGSFPLKYTRIG